MPEQKRNAVNKSIAKKKAPVSRARPASRPDVNAATKNASAKHVAKKTNTNKHPRSVGHENTAARAESVKVTKAVRKAESREEINRKLRRQTPSHREQARSIKKVGGSVKNLEIKRRESNIKQKFYVKKKKQGFMKMLLARFVLFFVLFALMFMIVAGLVALSLKSDSDSNDISYTLQLGDKAEDDESNLFEIAPENAVRNNVVYIPITQLNDMCKFTVTGTVVDLKFIPRESELQSVRFVADSNVAYVNGNKVRMVAPSFISNGELYIPLEFLTDYSTGLLIEKDENEKLIKVSRLIEGKDENKKIIYADVNFKLCDVQPLEITQLPVETPETTIE